MIPHIPPLLELGKTVQYRRFGGGEGVIKIEFSGKSPCRNKDGSEKTTIESTDLPVKLEVMGDFPCHCFITLPVRIENGITTPPKVFDWGQNSPQSGGNHVVR